MDTITIPAHFDGEHILLDRPYLLEADAKLLVSVLPDEEREAWLNVSARRLADAYGDVEPEYPLSAIREMNPHYDRR